MPSTYTPIATTTLGSAASSYTFTSIPGTYTDLVLVSSVLANSTADQLSMRINGDTGSNYSLTSLAGASNNVASSQRQSNVDKLSISGFQDAMGSTVPSPAISHIQNYNNSTTYKTVLSRSNSWYSSVYPTTTATVGLWRNTAGVTSLTLFFYGGNLLGAGSTFTLYGIKAA